MVVKITFIKKDREDNENPYVAILSLEWIDEKDKAFCVTPRIAMCNFIKNDGNGNTIGI